MTLEDQLIRDEGMRFTPYADTVGKITIGVGRNLTDLGISRAEALSLLANDIDHARQSLSQTFPWTDALDEVRRSALVNMTFNLGIGGLSQFRKFLGAMQAGQWAQASAEMLDSKWAQQVGSRANRLSLQIVSGDWQ